jgi:uncharacterized cupredoxin-like copper-binding protein
VTRFFVVLLASIAPLAILACSSSAATPAATSTAQATSTATPTAAASRIAITLKDFSVAAAPASAKAGDATFEVKNDGKLAHQFVVVKTDLDPGSLPQDEHKAVDESKVQIVSRIPDFDGGQTKTVAAKLTTGKYVLLCNVPFHYTSGMFTAFVVN